MATVNPIDREFAKGKQLHSRHSPFHNIEISQQGNLRLLHTDHQTVQSALNVDHPEQMPLPYMHAMMAGLLFQTPPKTCLLLGLGGGDLVRYLHHHLPACHVTAVEQDAQMVHISHQYFQRPRADNIAIHVDDAGEFIKQYQHPTDLLLIDLYGDKLPPLLDTAAFYDECHRALSSAGILAINLLTSDAEEFKSIVWKIRRRFKQQTLCLSVPQYSNTVVIAFKQRPTTLSRASLSNKTASLRETFGLDFEGLIENLFTTNPLTGGELCF